MISTQARAPASERKGSNRDYYFVNYCIDGDASLDAQVSKKSVESITIVRLQTKVCLALTRSLSHIRDDATDVSALWFVKSGQLSISQGSGRIIATAGEFAITKSMMPSSVECRTGMDLKHESLVIILPTHALRRFIPSDTTRGYCIPATERSFSIAESIVSGILDDSGELREETKQLLMNTALTVLTSAIRKKSVFTSIRPSMADHHLQNILRYVDMHLSDPKLNTRTIAAGCGISTRYLSYVLGKCGQPYAEIVWGRRLKIARQLLASRDPSDTSISQIAFRLGFKSAAHFSRMFRKVYAMTPSQYRDTI